MILDTHTPDSAPLEFYCPTCGRRIQITTQPAGRVVLVPGDANAQHVGGVGVEIQAEITDPYLAVWEAYLKDKLA
jgi:hypothetical protein